MLHSCELALGKQVGLGLKLADIIFRFLQFAKGVLSGCSEARTFCSGSCRDTWPYLALVVAEEDFFKPHFPPG